jgi:hypothetical protein
VTGRYRLWRTTTFVGRFALPEEQAADEINALYVDHGWVPLSITAVPGNVPEFAVLFDTHPRSESSLSDGSAS